MMHLCLDTCFHLLMFTAYDILMEDEVSMIFAVSQFIAKVGIFHK